MKLHAMFKQKTVARIAIAALALAASAQVFAGGVIGI